MTLKQRVTEALDADGYHMVTFELRYKLMREIIKELSEREAKLVEALKFYADLDNYDDNCAPFILITSHECVHEFMEKDLGKKAQGTLKGLGIE